MDGQQDDERSVPPADLFDKKIKEGMSPDSATAYVSRLHGPPPTMAPRDVTSAVKREPVKHQSLGQAATGAAEKMNQGATFGLSDEIGAVVGGLVADPLHPLKNYQTLKHQITAPAEQFAKEHPVLGAGSELAGAVGQGALSGAMGIAKPVAAQAIGTGAKLIRAAKDIGAGAASGAAYGAGTAEDGHRTEGAVSGALAGGGTVAGVKLAGKIISPLTSVGKNLMPRPKDASSTAGQVFNRVGAMTTEDLAHADVVKQLERAGLSLEDAASNARGAHPEQMLLDPSVGGKSMMRRARGAQSIPSKGSEDIERSLVTRGEQQPGRVQSALEEGMGHTRENAVLRAEQLSGERLAKSKPGYDAIQKVVIDDPEALALFDIPEFRAVHKSLVRNAEIRGGSKIQPLTTTEVIDGVKTKVQNPQTLGTLDKMKQHIDDIIAGKIDGGKVTRDRAYAMRDRLIQARDRLDEIHPEYGETRAQWAGDSKAIAGQEAGLDFSRTSRDELAAHFPRLSPQAQDEFRRSAVADIGERLAKVTDGGDVTRMLRNPLIREKLEVIAPTKAAFAQLEHDIAREAEMHKTGQFVMGGSQTARIQAEQGDEVGGKALGNIVGAATGNVRGMIQPLVTNAAVARARGLGEHQINALAPLLTAKGPQEIEKVIQKLRTVTQRQATTAQTRGSLLRAAGMVAADQSKP